MHRTRGAGAILLIEQDILVAAILIHLLEQQGYTVRIASTRHDALTWLRVMTPQPCLILLNLDFSLGEGMAFRREQLRDPALRAIPVVALTSQPIDPQDARELQLTFYLRKPVDAEQLRMIVESHCQVSHEDARYR